MFRTVTTAVACLAAAGALTTAQGPGQGPGHQGALDGVREHIKNTVAEANLTKELSESSLDSRLAALKNQVGDVQARKQLEELKAKRAAQQAAGTQKTM